MGRIKSATQRSCVVRQKTTRYGYSSSRKVLFSTPTPALRTSRGNSQRRGFKKAPPVEHSRLGSSHLSTIKESPLSDYNELMSDEKPRVEQTPEDAVCSRVMSGSTSHDTSDMIMPSGVSSFFLDCMDSSSPTLSSSSSCSTVDSSLPSPEVFRTADPYEDAMGFAVGGELVELPVKNSTLLDVSHAVDIDMRQPPNLSAILEISRELDEKDNKKGIRNRVENISTSFSTVQSGKITEIYLSEERVLQTETNIQLSTPSKYCSKTDKVNTIECRKKVTFKSVIVQKTVERFEPCEASGTQRRRSVAEANSHLQLGEDSGASPVKATPRPPVSQKQARVFDFTDCAEKNAFRPKKKGECPFVFPSKPMVLSSDPVPGKIHPIYVKFKNSEMHDPNKMYEMCWIQLLHEGEDVRYGPHIKKIVTDAGVFYEDYRRVNKFHGQGFFSFQ